MDKKTYVNGAEADAEHIQSFQDGGAESNDQHRQAFALEGCICSA